MAANKNASAASRRRVRLSGWVLSPFQVTLAVCGMIVGFLACFGLGFLSGVWFQTQEQMLPYDDAITLADNQLKREHMAPSAGQEMTFYSALPSRDGTPESMPQSPAGVVAASEPEAPASGTSTSTEAPKSEPTPPSTSDASSTSASSEPREGREATAPPEPKPKSEPKLPPVSAAKSTEKFYSIQVGSFRKVEQAYRLQDELLKKGYQAHIGFSIVEGKGAWYRVRVGRFADRGSADKTAQRLQQKEKVDVLVMRVSS